MQLIYATGYVFYTMYPATKDDKNIKIEICCLLILSESNSFDSVNEIHPVINMEFTKM